MNSPQGPRILKEGLAGTLIDVPYLTCEVVEGSSPKGSVMLSKTFQSIDDLFQIKDLSATADYFSLKSAQFSPLSMDGLDVFHTNLSGLDAGSLPVFRATLSVVRNGYLLLVSVHHSTTDITGFGALLKIWASYCRTGSSSSVQFTKVWLDRGRLLSTGTDDPTKCPTFLHFRKDLKTRKDANTMVFNDMESSILRFQRQRLEALKTKVMGHLPDGIPWISTGDILTAVLWSATLFAETHEDSGPGCVTTCSGNSERSIRIPVNFRGHYRPPLPADYLGAAFAISLASARDVDLKYIATGADHEMSILALARVAAAVRTAINLVDGEDMRSVVQYLATQTDLSNIEFGPYNESPSVVSWADEGIYSINWGCEIGNCDAVRLPAMKNKRWPIVLPRYQNGDLDVFVRLNKSQMKILENTWIMRLVKGTSLK